MSQSKYKGTYKSKNNCSTIPLCCWFRGLGVVICFDCCPLHPGITQCPALRSHVDSAAVRVQFSREQFVFYKRIVYTRIIIFVPQMSFLQTIACVNAVNLYTCDHTPMGPCNRSRPLLLIQCLQDHGMTETVTLVFSILGHSWTATGIQFCCHIYPI